MPVCPEASASRLLPSEDALGRVHVHIVVTSISSRCPLPARVESVLPPPGGCEGCQSPFAPGRWAVLAGWTPAD